MSAASAIANPLMDSVEFSPVLSLNEIVQTKRSQYRRLEGIPVLRLPWPYSTARIFWVLYNGNAPQFKVFWYNNTSYSTIYRSPQYAHIP